MTEPTPTRQLRDAIEDAANLHEDIVVYYSDNEARTADDLWKDIAEAVKAFYAERGMHLTRESNPSTFFAQTKSSEEKLKEIAEMENHVNRVLGTEIDLGGKWYQAVEWLIEVNKENGWDIEFLWRRLAEGFEEYTVGRLSFGMLTNPKNDPRALLKTWMTKVYREENAQPETAVEVFKPEPIAGVPNPYKKGKQCQT